MPRNAILVAIACTLCLAGLSCNPPSQDVAEMAEPHMELRTYQVPDGFEDETKGVLRYVLQTTENAHGRVSMGPGGQLVVLATASVHRGVEDLIKQLEATVNEPQSVPATIAMDYWFVVGRPAGETAGAALPEIAPALAEVSKRQGPMEYVLLEHLRLLTKENGRSRTMGAHYGAEQETSLAGGRIIADLQLMKGTTLRTEVNLKPGQLLVLAQSGYAGSVPRGDGLILLVVVRAELLSADG